MSFSDVATSKFFPLHRQHRAAEITPDGVRPLDGLLTGPIAIAAVLLDGIGATPQALSAGVHIVFANDLLEKGVKHLVKKAVAPAVPMWLMSRYDDETIIEAIQYGEVLVGIAEVEDRVPDSLIAVADKIWRLPDLDRSHVADAIRLMTGARVVRLPAVDYDLKTVLKALRPGLSAERVVADLKRLYSPKADVPAPPPATQQESKFSDLTPREVIPRLRDLAGYSTARVWVMQLAQDLQAYANGYLDWVDVDKGLLLSGGPGTGKSYFARALATECGVQLVTTSYGQWHGSNVGGDTVQKGLNKLFLDVRAKAAAGPVILFVDEIDSIGRRGTSVNGDYWYGLIINSWIAFLDEAEPCDGIVVIAATNRPDQIDDSMRRPGRLETHIALPPLSIEDLEGVLEHHVGKMSGLDRAARACRGLSPADITQVAREARRAARRAKRSVSAEDVSAVVNARRAGRDPAFDHLVCVHEAGHALVALDQGLRVRFVDADAKPAAVEAPTDSPSLAKLERHITTVLGGRAAEIAVFGHPSLGDVADLNFATAFALEAVVSGLTGNLVSLPQGLGVTTPAMRSTIEEIVSRCMDRATRIVESNLPALDALVAALAEKRYLDSEDLRSIALSEKTLVV
jgi:ATP-dependent Zn protease